MNTIILILLSLSLISSVLIIYLNFKSRNESNHEKENQEIERLNQEIINLKESLNTTINSTMSSMAIAIELMVLFIVVFKDSFKFIIS